MNCEWMMEKVDAFLDGELDAAIGREVERHAAECGPCAARLRSRRALLGVLKKNLVYHRAPAELRERLRGVAGDAEIAEVRAVAGGMDGIRWRRAALGWAAIAAVLAMTWGMILVQGRGGAGAATHEAQVAQAVLDDSLRSLQGAGGAGAQGHLVDVASSEATAVGPWFVGKTAFAPDVRSPAGYALLGGRMDVVLDRAVAAIVYRQGSGEGRVINLFTWPAREKGEAEGGIAMKELPNADRAAKWVENGMEYWAVADAGGAAAEDFAKAYVAAGDRR